MNFADERNNNNSNRLNSFKKRREGCFRLFLISALFAPDNATSSGNHHQSQPALIVIIRANLSQVEYVNVPRLASRQVRREREPGQLSGSKFDLCFVGLRTQRRDRTRVTMISHLCTGEIREHKLEASRR